MAAVPKQIEKNGGGMLDRLNASLNFYQQALDVRSQRQEVLAANIANADTPGYKARDFDFQAELDRVLSQGPAAGSGGLSLRTTAEGHIQGSAAAGAGALDLAYRRSAQPSLDGNTVDMDVERVEFIQNAIHYQANLQILGNKVKGLKAAMQPVR